MGVSTFLPQASLAAVILVATAGTYVALTPPNPAKNVVPPTGDSIRQFNFAGDYTTKIALAPFGVLALHASSLAYSRPNIPPYLLGYGAKNGLNTRLITWSAATCIPLGLILCAGVPLRLLSYTSLGSNFTFTLAEPDHLKTTGMYRYVQHPSYTGLVLLMFATVALLGRVDGVLSCWIPPSWYKAVRNAWWVTAPVAFGISLFGLWVRVGEEERMMGSTFGAEWEEWHASTARFVPWIF